MRSPEPPSADPVGRTFRLPRATKQRSTSPFATRAGDMGPAARATGPRWTLDLRGRWHRQRADLGEDRHQVEVMLCLSDLVALERHDLDRWDLHALVGGRNGPHRALELTVVRTLPDDLKDHGVTTLDGLRDRPLRVRECLPPALADLDDRVRPLRPALGRELLVHGIRAERGLEARPVTLAESLDVLLRQLKLVCHRVPPLSLVSRSARLRLPSPRLLPDASEQTAH